MVFNERKVVGTSTFQEPVSVPKGIHHVVVNERVAVRGGEPTGARAGKVLLSSR